MADVPNQLIDAVVTHASASGKFERVNKHEPKNYPGSGLTCAVFVSKIRPHMGNTGLKKTSAMIRLCARMYSNMLQEPQDSIDPDLTAAAFELFRRLTLDFTLGGLCQSIDLLGRSGFTLEAESGYIEIDKVLCRAIDMFIPIILNDTWQQGA